RARSRHSFGHPLRRSRRHRGPSVRPLRMPGVGDFADRRRKAGACDGARRRFMAISFPDGFLWGSATAAHQVEGGNWNNDWWAWEHASGTPCAEPSGDACDFYHRYEQDLALLARLGQRTCRFSVEWARIEPEEGEVSRAGQAAGLAAVKARPGSPKVGLGVALAEYEAVHGGEEQLARVKHLLHDVFLDAVRCDASDFIGVQTYTRNRIGRGGTLPPPDGAE